MNLRQLQYFKTIAELEHYTRAAEQLFVSQSNLSHSIKELEDELNVQLFVRKGRNVQLTKYGELFLPYVSQALDLLDNGVQCVNNYVNPDTGSVIVSGFPSLSEFIPEVVVRYISETNRVGVHVQFNQSADYETLKKQLKAGDIDLAFCTKIDDEVIGCAPIGEHQLVLLAPEDSPYDEGEAVDLSELDGQPFVAFNHSCELRFFTDSLFEKLDIHPKITMETAQDVLIYGMVAAKQGLAIAPKPIGGTPYRLKELKIANEIPNRQVYVAWNKVRYMPPAAAYLRDFILKKGMIFDQFFERRDKRRRQKLEEY
ncbi:MAG: LysR family transcriptional regulator [Clostridium sp.]|nr:LysR family transcriptional regulator [Clostridium sp.]